MEVIYRQQSAEGMPKVVLLRGDGIGPEVIGSAVKVVKAVGARVDFEEMEAGEKSYASQKSRMPKQVIDRIRAVGVAFMGPLGAPIEGIYLAPNGILRHNLDLFVSVRPAKSFRGVSKYQNVDVVTMMDVAGGFHANIEYYSDRAQSTAASVFVADEKNVARTAEFAFKYCKSERRKKMALVTFQGFPDHLWRRVTRKIAGQYPKVEYREYLCDNMAQQLVQNPEEFDILLCPDIYGDIFSDLNGGLIGSIGMCPAETVGENARVFQGISGPFPRLAGKDRANPTGAILAGALLLKYLGEKEVALRIERAVRKVIEERIALTYDMAGDSKTSEFVDAVIENL